MRHVSALPNLRPRVCLPAIALLLLSPFLMLGCNPQGAPMSPQQDSLAVGGLLVLSGPNSHYGEDTKAGMEVGLSHVNRRGVSPPAINGVTRRLSLTIKFENSHGGPNNTVNAPERFNALIAEGVPAVLGEFFSGVTLSLAPIANDRQRVLLTPCSTNYKLRQAGPWVFRILPTDYEQALQMSEYARLALQASRAAVFFVDNAYGQDLAAAFRKDFIARGGAVVFDKSFAEGAKEFAGFISSLRQSKPDLVFLVGHTQEMVDILKTKEKAEARSGASIPVLGTDGMYDETFLKTAGSAAEGIVLASAGFNPQGSEPIVREFADAFKARFGREPNLWAAGGFDSVLVLAEAIRLGGTSPADIQRGLRMVQNLAGATGLHTTDETGGMGGKQVFKFKAQGGVFVRLE